VFPRPLKGETAGEASSRPCELPIQRDVMSNVDERLLARFEASWERERARRETLPPAWLQSELRPADHLGDLFDDVLERARARVLAQRTELDLLETDGGLDSAV
jgi:hypothetical protein